MLGGKIPFSLASIAFASAALAAASCASILGIEEIHPDSDGGSTSVGTAGSSTSGSAGASGSEARPRRVDRLALAPVGGSGAVSGSSGGSTVATGSGGAAGSAPDASATGGASGARDGGVSEGGPPITVHGTVIDYWRHRVPNIDVFLGTATTKTDANGQFTFNNVSPPYDIGLALRLGQLQFGGAEDAWLFRGLKTGGSDAAGEGGFRRRFIEWHHLEVPEFSCAGRNVGTLPVHGPLVRFARYQLERDVHRRRRHRSRCVFLRSRRRHECPARPRALLWETTAPPTLRWSLPHDFWLSIRKPSPSTR